MLPIILAAWRETRAEARTIDADEAVPWWLPVIMAHPRIRVGPVFGPNLPGCYDCLLDRVLAADEQAHLTRALWDLYDRDPTAGPLGYLEHHAGVAAALATMLIGRDDAARRQILYYDVLDGTLRAEAFVPSDDCPRWRRAEAQRDQVARSDSAGAGW
nr:TOMM precursor leader peptide-binding protein [Micromonospora tarapacensis]